MPPARRLAAAVLCLVMSLVVAGPSLAGPKLLVDMQTGDVLYAEDAGAPWHPASLTKLMTAYVTFQAIADGRITLDSLVTMTRDAANQAPARSGMAVGNTLTLKDALYVMLVKSANDMAVAVAEAVDGSADRFAAEMNATAARLGLMRTHYNNVNGLPDDGQVTTARDLAVLTIDLRRTFPQYADIFRTREVKLDNVYLKSDNALLNTFAGTDGMKTGFICSAGLNIVATAHRNGRELMAIVLGGSSGRERDEMAAQMLLRGFAGEYPDKGESVVNLLDDLKSPPTDMAPYICGKKAKEYVRAQRKAYPMGLPGKPSFLTDKIASIVYNATDLGPAGGPAVASAADTPDAQGDGDGPPDAVVKAASAPIPMPRRVSRHHHRR